MIELKLEAMYTTTLSRKVFVQRDFSEGRVVRFASRFPVVLEGKMDMQLSDFTINSLNRLYAEVEKVSTYCEGCFGLPTAHITAVVDQEGLLLTDPVLRGSVWCRSPCRQRVRGHQANCSTVFIGVVKLLSMQNQYRMK